MATWSPRRALAGTSPRHDATPSLRRALLLGLLLPLAALIPLAALLVYSLALRPALDALDRALTDTAVALAEIVELRDGQPQLPLSEQTARALRADLLDETQFAVAGPDGRLLGGHPALLALAPPARVGEWQFFSSRLAGRELRATVFGRDCRAAPAAPPAPCSIVVAETLNKRAAAERAALWGALLAALALALPLWLLAAFAVRRALRPLHRAAAEVEALGPARLDAIDTRGVPDEAVGFVHALNRLLDRLRQAASAQRAFVADAAHQLRTPLAVMRLEAGEALTQPHPQALRPTLERLHAAAERGSRLAQQLLSLARAEGVALDPGAQPRTLDLAALAATCADRWLTPILEAGQDLVCELEPVSLPGHAVLLEELIGNLLHNATEHAGAGAQIALRTRTVAAGEPGDLSAPGLAQAVIEVEDDGPGIPEDDQAGVWQRFHRGSQARGNGSGLGLAIVADITALHGGRATLQSPVDTTGRGLRVCIRLPLAPP